MTTFSNTRINHCLLVRFNINGNIYRLTNHYQPITYNGEQYLALASMLGVTNIQNDIEPTNEGIGISLQGISLEVWGDNAGLILDAKVKGSPVQVYRMLLSDNLATGNVYLRFSGIISEMSIQDDIAEDGVTASRIISLNCTNINSILMNRIAGRRTNDVDYLLDADVNFNDPSMSRVRDLHNTQFEFGRPYKGTPGQQGRVRPGPDSGGGSYGQYEPVGKGL